MSEIQAGVLVVTGEDDVFTPPKFGDYLVKNIRKAQRVHIMNAGHLLPVEKPEELNRAILQFLADGPSKS